jgi:hypothetical protein
MLHPIHKFQMTSSKGLSKAWLSCKVFDELVIIGGKS